MAYINADVIDEIKYRNSIDEVVSMYVPLKRAGSNLVGLCPFHSEKTPSFTVFPNDGSFHCFGCGVGGDVITFIRRVESVDYRAALEILAKRAGITIVTEESEKDRRAIEERARILKMNRDAARYFNDILMNSPKGENGRRYFSERGLSTATIRHFGLGYAPDSFGELVSYLTGLGYKDYEMSKGFLCGISKKNGRPYDYFRGRVIFPIIDTTGDVIAFGGRVLDNSVPKYLNTSDTPAFKKSRTLFALNFAKSHSSEQLIMCEGYMDVIALHAAGFENAVATLGTAITPEHARLMKKYTKSVVISYDSDDAGQRAADKAFRLLSEVGLEAKIITMTGAKDPDEFIRRFGKGKFRGLLESTKSEFDFKFDALCQRYGLTTDDGRIKILEESEKIIAAIPSAAQRDVYMFRVSERLGVSADAIKSDVMRRIRSRERAEKQDETRRMMSSAQGVGDRVNRDYMKNPAAASAEEQILGILILHPEYIREAENKKRRLKVDDFFTEFGKKVLSAMLSLGEEMSEGTLGEFLALEEMERLAEIKLKRSRLSNNTIEVMFECLDALKRAKEKEEATTEDIIRAKKKKTEDKK